MSTHLLKIFLLLVTAGALVITLVLWRHQATLTTKYFYNVRGIFSRNYLSTKPFFGSKTQEKIEKTFHYLNTTKGDAIFPGYGMGEYLLLNPNICKDTSRVHVIIIVHTATRNFQRRLRLRRTFANSSLFLPLQIRTAFLLGKARDAETQRKMVLEHAQYKDTIMGDFYDDYHNLTLKGTMGFRWISEYCPNSDIVLKIDDDVIVDMYKLIEIYLDFFHGRKKSLFCNIWYNDSMPILRQGKWKVPDNLFYNMWGFPYNYCSGFTVLMTSDLMAPMYHAAKITPFFWIDDLYLFGMLPTVVGGVTYHYFELGKNLSSGWDKFFPCLEGKGEHCPYFSSLIEDKDYDRAWSKIVQVHKGTSWIPATVRVP